MRVFNDVVRARSTRGGLHAGVGDAKGMRGGTYTQALIAVFNTTQGPGVRGHRQ